MKRKKNPIDVLIVSALALTGLLYVLQLWQWVNVTPWLILLPVGLASLLVVLVIAIAGMVAMIYRKHDEKET